MRTKGVMWRVRDRWASLGLVASSLALAGASVHLYGRGELDGGNALSLLLGSIVLAGVPIAETLRDVRETRRIRERLGPTGDRSRELREEEARRPSTPAPSP